MTAHESSMYGLREEDAADKNLEKGSNLEQRWLVVCVCVWCRGAGPMGRIGRGFSWISWMWAFWHSFYLMFSWNP